MDDMLVKSLRVDNHLTHLTKMFNLFYTYNIKLNPNKCVFRVSSENFLTFMVNQRGIEVNLDKIKAVLEMEAPRAVMEVQRLTERLTNLNHFVSKATDRYLSFFQV